MLNVMTRKRFAAHTTQQWEPANESSQLGRKRPVFTLQVLLLMTVLLSSFLNVEPASARSWHVATDGSDDNAGTATEPLRSWQAAVDQATPGDQVLIRPGTYQVTGNHGYGVRIRQSGTASEPIILRGDGGRPVLDCRGLSSDRRMYCLDVKADWWRIEDIAVTGVRQLTQGAWAVGIILQESNRNVLRRVESYRHQGPGIVIEGNSSHNLLRDCDAYENYDPLANSPGGNADGIDLVALPKEAIGNQVINCRTWSNSDDGLDLWEAEAPVTVKGVWSFQNGYVPNTIIPSGNGSGFKLGRNSTGPTHHIVQNLSVFNRNLGFDGNAASGSINVFNNTAYQNGRVNFALNDPGVAHVLRNNVGFDGPNSFDSAVSDETNNWNLSPETIVSDFNSLDSSGLKGPRTEDGTLPTLSFLHPSLNSSLIDRGVDVGLPFHGTAPDLGAFEIRPNPVPVNDPPVINAGADVTAQLSDILSLTGTVNDDGLPSNGTLSVMWAQVSGPGTVTFTDVNNASTQVSFSQVGDYVLQLSASDGALTSRDEVSLTLLEPNPPPPNPSPTTTWHVATDGSDQNVGTAEQPLQSWQAAVDRAMPGDHILIRPGTYHVTDTRSYGVRIRTSGTMEAPITIEGNGGRPVLDCGELQNDSGMYCLDVKADWWRIKDIDVTGATQRTQGAWAVGIILQNSNHNVLDRVASYRHQGPGILVEGRSAHNLLHNCDAYENYDPLSTSPGGNGDGIQLVALPKRAKGNQVIDCRTWSNSDDGLDLWQAEAPVLVKGVWSFRNGYIPNTFMPAGNGSGFKMGRNTRRPRHQFFQNLAVANREFGFNANKASGPISVFNNTAYQNGIANFALNDRRVAHVLKNNISFDGPNIFKPDVVQMANNWNLSPETIASDFLNLDASGLDGPREMNGSLPKLQFLRLSLNSSLIDRGIDVGLPFSGTAPDLGAFETEPGS